MRSSPGQLGGAGFGQGNNCPLRGRVDTRSNERHPGPNAGNVDHGAATLPCLQPPLQQLPREDLTHDEGALRAMGDTQYSKYMVSRVTQGAPDTCKTQRKGLSNYSEL